MEQEAPLFSEQSGSNLLGHKWPESEGATASAVPDTPSAGPAQASC